MKLVDMQVLGACAVRCVGSSPTGGKGPLVLFFYTTFLTRRLDYRIDVAQKSFNSVTNELSISPFKGELKCFFIRAVRHIHRSIFQVWPGMANNLFVNYKNLTTSASAKQCIATTIVFLMCESGILYS